MMMSVNTSSPKSESINTTARIHMTVETIRATGTEAMVKTGIETVDIAVNILNIKSMSWRVTKTDENLLYKGDLSLNIKAADLETVICWMILQRVSPSLGNLH